MINIVYACDNNYVPYLAVAITSVCINNNVAITFYILDNEINEENKHFLRSYEKKYSNIKIIFIECNNLERKLNLPSFLIDGNMSMNLTTYSRLFLASLLPLDIDKVLYLDCDTLVLNSLEEFWNIDIEDYMCAGVDDPAPIALKETINFKEDDFYVNAGVLLINLKKWREHGVELDFIKFINNNRNNFYQHDQGIINACLKNKIRIIHPKYNYLAYFYRKSDINTIIKWNGCKYYYDKKIMEEASECSVIKHCKPFQSPEDYKKYIQLSEIDDKSIFNFHAPVGFFSVTNFFEKSYGRKILKFTPSFVAVNLFNFRIRKHIKKNNSTKD